MASKNTAVLKLVGDNHDLRKALQDSERRVKGLEKAVARTKNNTKGAFSPLTESALKSLGPLGTLTKKLHGVAGEMRAASGQAKKTGDDVNGMGGKFDGIAGRFGKIGGLAKSMAGPLAAAGVALGGIAAAGELLKDSVEKLKTLAAATRTLKRETGMSAETASAWIGIGSRMGVTADKLSTSFGIFSKKLAPVMLGTGKGSQKMAKVFEDLKVSSEAIANGDMDTVLMNIADAFKAMPDGAIKTKTAMELFGRGGKTLIPILNQGSDGLASLKNEMSAFGLTITDDALEQSKDLAKSQKVLNQLWDGMQIQLATKVIPYLSEAAVKFKDFIVAIRTGKTEPGTFTDNMRGLGDTVGQVFTFLGNHTKSLKLAFRTNFPYISNAVNLLSFAFTGGFSKAGRAISRFVSGAVTRVRTNFGRLFGFLGSIPGVFSSAFTKVQRYLSGLPGRMASAARRIGSAIVRGVSSTGGGVVNWANRTLGKAISVVGGLTGRMRNAAVRVGRAILGGLRSGVGSLWGAVKGPMQAAINGIIRGINWMIGKANGLIKKIPDKVRGVLGIGTIGLVPQVRLAEGAIVKRATVAMIGEAGPEAIIPLSPNRRARGQQLYAEAGRALGMTSSGHSMTFNVVNNGNQLDEQALASKLAWQLQTRGI